MQASRDLGGPSSAEQRTEMGGTWLRQFQRCNAWQKGVADAFSSIRDPFQQVVRPLKTGTARRGNLAGLEASFNFEFWEEVDLH